MPQYLLSVHSVDGEARDPMTDEEAFLPRSRPPGHRPPGPEGQRLPTVPAGWSGSSSASLPRGAAARRKTACHELGHVFGLEHRRTGRTCMRDGFTTMYGHPDGTDYANLRRIYARP